jgi:hypothetical protein
MLNPPLGDTIRPPPLDHANNLRHYCKCQRRFARFILIASESSIHIAGIGSRYRESLKQHGKPIQPTKRKRLGLTRKSD